MTSANDALSLSGDFSGQSGVFKRNNQCLSHRHGGNQGAKPAPGRSLARKSSALCSPVRNWGPRCFTCMRAMMTADRPGRRRPTPESSPVSGKRTTVAGRCRVGGRDLLATGSIVIDGFRIGDDLVLGAGATAIRDLLEPGVYIGTPARKLDK